MLESLTVGVQSRIVIHAASHVGPVSGSYFAARCFLKIHDAERLFGIADNIRNLRGSLCKCVDAAKGCYVRASGKKAQKSPAAIAPWSETGHRDFVLPSMPAGSIHQTVRSAVN